MPAPLKLASLDSSGFSFAGRSLRGARPVPLFSLPECRDYNGRLSANHHNPTPGRKTMKPNTETSLVTLLYFIAEELSAIRSALEHIAHEKTPPKMPRGAFKPPPVQS